MDAALVGLIIGLLGAQTAFLGGIFLRLGAHGARLDAVELSLKHHERNNHERNFSKAL